MVLVVIAALLAVAVAVALIMWRGQQNIDDAARMKRRLERRMESHRAFQAKRLAPALTTLNSFANPAIAMTRPLSDSFAGIAPGSVPGFIAAQLAGALVAHLVAETIFTPAAIEVA